MEHWPRVRFSGVQSGRSRGAQVSGAQTGQSSSNSARISGAAVSSCALPNEYKGLPQQVTIRDVVSTYIYSNTLVVLSMTREELRQYIERSACYFALDADGNVILGETFMRPKVQHYNYDFFSGIDYTIDVRKPAGSRVTSIRLNGEAQSAEAARARLEAIAARIRIEVD